MKQDLPNQNVSPLRNPIEDIRRGRALERPLSNERTSAISVEKLISPLRAQIRSSSPLRNMSNHHIRPQQLFVDEKEPLHRDDSTGLRSKSPKF